MSLRRVHSALEAIAEVKNKAGKAKLIKEALAGDYAGDFKSVVVLAKHPHMRYYARSLRGHDGVAGAKVDNQEIFNFLRSIADKGSSTNADIDHLGSLCEDLETYNVVERIIKKDLMCGIGMETAIKFFKADIPEWPTMLATAQSQKTLNKIIDGNRVVSSELKEDGGFFNIVIRPDEDLTYRSRDGNIIFIDEPELKNEAEQIAAEIKINWNGVLNFDSGMVFIGECLFVDPKTGKFYSRKKSNGKLLKGISGSISLEECKGMEVHLWDVVPYDKFLEKRWEVTQEDRRLILSEILDEYNTDYIKLVESKSVSTLEDVIEHYSDVRNRDLTDTKYEFQLEGTVVKDPKAPWESKRSPFFVKLKNKSDCDLEVFDWTPHEKNPDWIGSLMCRSSCGGLIVSVGNLRDEERAKPFDFYEGKIVEVQYNEVIDSETKNTKSLFIPRFDKERENFDMIRDDKTEANSLKEIK